MKTLYVLLLCSPSLFAQATTGGLTSKGVVNSGGATSTAPAKSGTSLPATCGVGQQYFKTDAAAGQNLYGCTATNTWTVLGGSALTSGMILLESHTANNTATALNFTTCFSSAYKEYEILIESLFDATNSQTIIMQISSDGGATYDTTGHYNQGLFFIPLDFGDHSYTLYINQVGLYLSFPAATSNLANGGISGRARLHNPLSTAVIKVLDTDFSGEYDSTNWYRVTASGRYANAGNTAAINAFRITTYASTGAFAAGGNLTSGTVSCYGIAQ